MVRPSQLGEIEAEITEAGAEQRWATFRRAGLVHGDADGDHSHGRPDP